MTRALFLLTLSVFSSFALADNKTDLILVGEEPVPVLNLYFATGTPPEIRFRALQIIAHASVEAAWKPHRKRVLQALGDGIDARARGEGDPLCNEILKSADKWQGMIEFGFLRAIQRFGSEAASLQPSLDRVEKRYRAELAQRPQSPYLKSAIGKVAITRNAIQEH